MLHIIALFFLITSILFFASMFRLIFRTDKRLERRMKHYLTNPTEKITEKQFKVFLNFNLTKKKITKNLLTREKNIKLETFIARSGLPLKPEEYVLFQWICSAFTGFFFVLLSDQWITLIIGAILGFQIPKLYIKKKIKNRLEKFNERLPDMISTIVGSLRAGFSFPQALKTVIEEADSPIKEEMETVLIKMQYGSSLEEALNDLKERMPSEDLDLMIQAILIQRQVGGNLAVVLDKIVETIRDRTKIQRQIKTLTAQGRLSGIVIGLLPILLAVALYLIQPEYIETLFSHPVGLALVASGAVLGIIGFILIKKITTIEV